jgi:cytidine deaminase
MRITGEYTTSTVRSMCDIHFVGTKRFNTAGGFEEIHVTDVSIFPCGDCTRRFREFSEEVDVLGPYMRMVKDSVKDRPKGMD